MFRRRRRGALVITDFTPAELVWQDGPPVLNAFGATAYSRAIARNAAHQVLPPANQPVITYTSGTTANVTVGSSTGLCTAVANGTSVITAASTGLTSITQTATVSQVVASISGPTTFSTTDSASGSSPWATYTPKDANGNTVAGASITYGPSDLNSVFQVTNASTGAWAGQSAGTAHVPVSSGGVSITVTITVTHAAASLDPTNTTTGQGILGTNPTAKPVWFFYANAYDSDAGGSKPFRADLSSNIGGTGSGGTNNTTDFVKFGDGVNPGDARWVSTPDAAYGPGFTGPCIEFTFPANNVAATMGQHGTLEAILSSTWRPSSLWFIRQVAMCSTPRWTGVGDADNTYWGQVWNNGGTLTSAFTITPAITTTGVQTVATSPNHFTSSCTYGTVIIEPGGANQETLTYDGTATPAAGKFTQGADSGHLIINPTKTHSAGAVCNVTFTAGQGPGWKHGGTATFVGAGDSRVETTNWSNTAVGGSIPGANYVPQNLPGGNNGGVTESYLIGNTDASFNDGTLVRELVRWEHWKRVSDSTYWAAETIWRWASTASAWTRIGRRVVVQTTATSLYQYYILTMTGLNMNQSFKTTQKYWLPRAAFFDAENPNNDGSDDPAHALAAERSMMPENATGLGVSNVSASGMTLQVINPGRFTGKYRAKIDGTWVTGQDYTLQREDGEITENSAGTSTLQTTVTFSLAGLSLSNGDHPVEVHAVSADGTQIEPTGVSNTATVGTSASGFVNSSSIDAGSGYTTGTYTTPAFNVTSGNLILAFVESDTPGSQTIVVTDSASNSYTQVTSVVNGRTHLHIFYAKNVTGNAALTVSVTDSLNDSNGFKLTAMQYTGFSAATPIDGNTSGSGTTGSATTGTLTPTGAADTIVGFGKATSGTVITPSGWTSRSARAGFDKKLSAATPTSVTVTSTDSTATVLAALVGLKQ